MYIADLDLVKVHQYFVQPEKEEVQRNKDRKNYQFLLDSDEDSDDESSDEDELPILIWNHVYDFSDDDYSDDGDNYDNDFNTNDTHSYEVQ